MCKRHAICEGQSDCIYVVNGVDCSAEGLAAMTEVPFRLSNLGEMALSVIDACPTIPMIDASRIAAYLDSLGYCKTPF